MVELTEQTKQQQGLEAFNALNGKEISIHKLKRAINVRCLDRVGVL